MQSPKSNSKCLLEINNVSKTYKKSRDHDLLTLKDIKFDMFEDEIIALLGKSGSGKSTLMRIIAGLTAPTTGEVKYQGTRIDKPANGIAMVFQNFALLPWLSVLENVELGLQAKNLNKKECRKRALEVIDMIGLDGFESAYPKELSGGMQQRVGMARALVVNPKVLLMDEPFSALDVLTAENLRSDLLDLWENKKIQTKSILLITHNIQEAAMIADRIIIIGSDPGHIRADIPVNLPYPRHEKAKEFQQLIDDIYTYMTTTKLERYFPAATYSKIYETMDLHYRLPDAEVDEITGLMDILVQSKHKGKMDLPDVAAELKLEADSLFPLLEALEILRFAHVSKGDIELTQAGIQFADADILERKKIFSKQLAAYVPLAKHISHTLNKDDNNQANEEFFLKELQQKLSKEEAERVLTVIIDWGRYAEIFAYDYDAGILNLENPI